MHATSSTTEFEALTRPHLPRLFRIGMRLTREASDSDDLVQEALCRAWANWSRFERGGSLGAWLSRILVNAFISRHRHQRVVAAAATRSDIADHLYDPRRRREARDPEQCWQAELLSDEVVAALDQLPEHYRVVVDLVDLEGLPYREAATQLGVPVGTVMSRLHRARRILRATLADYAQTIGLSRVPELACAA